MAKLALVHAAPSIVGSAKPAPIHAAIALLVQEGARVLVAGCGDGALLDALSQTRAARTQGLERNPALVRRCIERGHAVMQAEPESDLVNFPAGAFDYVVFAHTFLGAREPAALLRSAARVGERLIVSIDNAGHWRRRTTLLSAGRLHDWSAGAMCTLRDFAKLVNDAHLHVERATPLSDGYPGAPFAKTLWRANWFAEQAVFLLAP